MGAKLLQSCLALCDTVVRQAPPSMGFSRQDFWSGLPFPSPGDLPDPGVEPGCPALKADALPSEPPGKPNGKWKVTFKNCMLSILHNDNTFTIIVLNRKDKDKCSIITNKLQFSTLSI